VAAGATAAEPSLIALVNVSTPLAALVNPNNKPPDIILAAFSELLKLVQGPNKTPPKYSPNGLTTLIALGHTSYCSCYFS
jgi:hypothetical protein